MYEIRHFEEKLIRPIRSADGSRSGRYSVFLEKRGRTVPARPEPGC
eukprot:CAMPEP_0197251722 /NCGR_PEP_ID=MMETSP1429-20130617/58360_1 /TAXON_ID=49237 /ORGANISM="Chaetoceros  sp., Strain UNC1202" /LENGTH=45 /DNA_ID= /DNA_START= /DNA_END= /DNA_ORIENTATION=